MSRGNKKAKRRQKNAPNPNPRPNTKEVAVINNAPAQNPVAIQNWNLTEDKIQALVGAAIIPNGTPPAQIEVFSRICSARQLDPFSKEIYLLSYTSKKTGITTYNPIVGIMGYRKLAFMTNEHMGTSDAVFNMKGDGIGLTAYEVILTGQPPRSATVTVNKLLNGNIIEFTHTCLLNEFASFYNGQLNDKWKTMTCQMLSKCAEAFALRKAWPALYAGTSIPEERAAYEGDQHTKRITLNAKAQAAQKDKTATDKEKQAKDAHAKIESIDEQDSEALTTLTGIWIPAFANDAGLVRAFASKKREIVDHIGATLEGLDTEKAIQEYHQANTQWHTIKFVEELFRARLQEINQ